MINQFLQSLTNMQLKCTQWELINHNRIFSLYSTVIDQFLQPQSQLRVCAIVEFTFSYWFDCSIEKREKKRLRHFAWIINVNVCIKVRVLLSKCAVGRGNRANVIQVINYIVSLWYLRAIIVSLMIIEYVSRARSFFARFIDWI